MTDVIPEAASNGAEAAPAIRVLAQFIRDLSFENPHAPDSMQPGPTPPQIDMAVELNARGRADGLFEVDMKLNVGAERGSETVFRLELAYGGLFAVSGVPDGDIEAVLLIECPRFLFPFVRRLVCDLTTDGGFPPLLLDPMDFAAIYAARKAAAGGVAGNA